MLKPIARYLDNDDPNGRLHLQHGPIDLVIGVDGGDASRFDPAKRRCAFASAIGRFDTVLEELVSELALIRAPVSKGSKIPSGRVAQRMMDAVRPFSEQHFITPMAAVAGAVADEMMAAMLAAFAADDCPERIYVNNGGDIAIHLSGDAEFRILIAREDGASFGTFALKAIDVPRGIATSGRGGRSLSMGIADSVTAIARNAAAADAAATIVANAVDLPGHPAIRRLPAIDVADDSDLGEHLVVVGCGLLSDDEIDTALARGVETAEALVGRDLIDRAALFLKSKGRLATPSPGLATLKSSAQKTNFSMELSSHA
jgi:ApbE superfamily uncharacterized protein (UPF0280 family)